MEISAEELKQIGRVAAQQVLEELHRYTVKYREPQTIEQGLGESMIEERTAASWYRRRGSLARVSGDSITADLYEHIAQEEDQHYDEFSQRIDDLTKHGAM